ncbi:MAG: putative anti-sigma factor antagonist BtrV [Lentisphaerae bacterium ADurb.Bin242]|nr:MAG: putative anti-sigma factor antagonist BtrV [Lentisphaerae bacterium ADurb.Bin242]
MKISKNQEADKLTLTLVLNGRLDTTTSSILAEEITPEALAEINELVLDLAGIDYVSSAGLRVILDAQKKMNQKKGKMTLTKVNESVMEVFEMTGFTDILTIERA